METDELLFHSGELLPISDLVNLLSSNSPSSDDANPQFITSPIPIDEVVSIRRERVKASEAKRRERIGDLMKDLEALVAKESGTQSKKRKLTKEEVLRQSITLLNCYMNKEAQSPPDVPSFEVARAIKRHKGGVGLFDLPISKEEELIAFKVLFQRAHTMEYIQSRNKIDYLAVLRHLDDLASSIGRVEFKFCVSWLLETFFGFISLQISELESINNRAQQYYDEMKALKRKPVLFSTMPCQMDSELFLNIDKAMLHAFRGKFQDALDTFRSARTLAHRLSTRADMCYYYCSIGCFYYALGERIPYNEAVECFRHCPKEDDVMGSAFSFLFDYQIALSELEDARDATSKSTALEHLIRGVSGFGNFCPEAKFILAALLLYGYLIAGSISEGLALADETLKKSIELGLYGAFGRAEILRLKAELLMKQNEDKEFNFQLSQEIRLLLQNALTNSSTSQSYTIHLKSAVSFCNFIFQINLLGKSNTSEIQEAIQTLNDALKKVQPYQQSTLIRDANVIMEKLLTLQDLSTTNSLWLL